MRSLTQGLMASIAFAPPDSDDGPTPFDLASFLGAKQDGGGEIPEGMGADRKQWGWDKFEVSDFVLVGMDEAASALSSANSFGKGTKGRNGKPPREERGFASRQLFLDPFSGDTSETQDETFTMKVKEIRRIS